MWGQLKGRSKFSLEYYACLRRKLFIRDIFKNNFIEERATRVRIFLILLIDAIVPAFKLLL